MLLQEWLETDPPCTLVDPYGSAGRHNGLSSIFLFQSELEDLNWHNRVAPGLDNVVFFRRKIAHRVHQHRNTTPNIHSEMPTSLGNTRHLVLSNSGRGCSRFVVPQLKYVHTAGPSQRDTKNQ